MSRLFGVILLFQVVFTQSAWAVKDKCASGLKSAEEVLPHNAALVIYPKVEMAKRSHERLIKNMSSAGVANIKWKDDIKAYVGVKTENLSIAQLEKDKRILSVGVQIKVVLDKKYVKDVSMAQNVLAQLQNFGFVESWKSEFRNPQVIPNRFDGFLRDLENFVKISEIVGVKNVAISQERRPVRIEE